jgi:hypothetical protein
VVGRAVLVLPLVPLFTRHEVDHYTLVEVDQLAELCRVLELAALVLLDYDHDVEVEFRVVVRLEDERPGPSAVLGPCPPPRLADLDELFHRRDSPRECGLLDLVECVAERAAGRLAGRSHCMRDWSSWPPLA